MVLKFLRELDYEYLLQVLLAARVKIEGYNVERLNNAFNMQV